MTEHNVGESRQALEALAWRICTAGRLPVAVNAVELTLLERPIEDGILLECNEGLRFADEQSMVEAATQHILRTESGQLLRHPKDCFTRLHEIFSTEIAKRSTVSGRVLAELHNTDRLDAFVWGRQAIEAGVGIFDVLHIMKAAVLLFTRAQAEPIYEFFTGHYEKVKDDLAGGLIYAKLPPWFAQQLAVSRELKQLHEAGAHERSATLYGCVLHGLILHEFADGFALALAAAQASDSTIAGPALRILGLVDYSDPSHRAAAEKVVERCTDIERQLF